jgi:HlyD family secretion protein
VQPVPVAEYELATAERGALALVVEAAGVIEPVSPVELKSKASGEILEIGRRNGRRGAARCAAGPDRSAHTPRKPARTGRVPAECAQAQRSTTRSQLERGKTLLASQWINQAEFDQLELAVANAEGRRVRSAGRC